MSEAPHKTEIFGLVNNTIWYHATFSNIGPVKFFGKIKYSHLAFEHFVFHGLIAAKHFYKSNKRRVAIFEQSVRSDGMEFLL